MSEWISVFDMLPADATTGVHDAVQYLVHVDVHNYGGYIQIAMWINNRFAGFPQGGADVTHWMPLPQPPKTDK